MTCGKCLRIMRSDYLKIHMLQHEKGNYQNEMFCCVHCNYNSTSMWCVKIHMQRKHSHILDQENVGEDIAGSRVNTPFTELNELHVKDEVKDPELLEDSIKRKCEENAINVDELTKMFESMTLK